MLAVIPFVSAGVPKKVQDLQWDENLCVPYFIPEMNEYDSSGNIHFRFGYGRSVEEAEDNSWPLNPYNCHFYIDGEEIRLQRYSEKRDDGTLDPPKLWMWYHIFGPDYFTPGAEHEIRIETWVLKPYEGDMVLGWRLIDVGEFTVYFY